MWYGQLSGCLFMKFVRHTVFSTIADSTRMLCTLKRLPALSSRAWTLWLMALLEERDLLVP